MSRDPKLLEAWALQPPLEVHQFPDGRTLALIDDNDFNAALLRDPDGTPVGIEFGLSHAGFEELVKTL